MPPPSASCCATCRRRPGCCPPWSPAAGMAPCRWCSPTAPNFRCAARRSAGPGRRRRRWRHAATWSGSGGWTPRPPVPNRTGCSTRSRGRKPRWCRSTRTTAHCAPSSAATATPARSSTAPPRRGASRAPASSHSCTPPPSSAASTRRRSSSTPRSCSRIGAGTCGARRTTPATSPGRCACARPWCSHATWSRFACWMRSAWTTHDATSATSASTRPTCPPTCRCRWEAPR